LETHPGLGTGAAVGINPDVLGDDVVLLVELEVLVELQEGQELARRLLPGRSRSATALTVSVREITASAVAYG